MRYYELMNTQFGEPKIIRSLPHAGQVAEHVRAKILSGEFPAGEKLPSARELSKSWELPEVTVHRAFSMLLKEGLVSRRPRIGTIVNEADRKLKTVVLYIRHESWAGLSQFSGLLLDLLEKDIRGRGIECVTLNDTSGDTGFKQLESLVERRSVQAVIVPSSNQTLDSKLESLPVPFACMTTARRSNGVSSLDDSLVDMAVEGLKKQGCRKAGLLSSMAEGDEASRRRFFERFRKLAKKKGMEIRDEWVLAAPANSVPTQNDKCRFAYQGFRKLWAPPERPDGIFVYTDDLIQGTLLAIAESGVSVPDELRLVFHRNLELPVFCPLPCAFVENSVADLARRLVDVVDGLFHGRKPEPGKHQYKLTLHQVDS